LDSSEIPEIRAAIFAADKICSKEKEFAKRLLVSVAIMLDGKKDITLKD